MYREVFKGNTYQHSICKKDNPLLLTDESKTCQEYSAKTKKERKAGHVKILEDKTDFFEYQIHDY